MKNDYPHLPPGREPGPQSRRNRRGLPLTWWFVGIVGFLMFLAGVFVAAGGRGERFSGTDELIGGAFFGLVGALCAAVAYWQYTRLQPPRLESYVRGVRLALDREEARRGDAVTATITPAGAADLQVGLVCDERYDYLASGFSAKTGAFNVRQTGLAVVHEDWRTVRADAGEQVLAFEIPAGAPPSYEGDALSYAWRVSARLPREGRPDPRLDAPLWVRA